MKLKTFITFLAFLTITTFLYVHQRVEAVKLSYFINKNESTLNKLLDQRRELEYNVTKMKAPGELELKLAREEIDLVLPQRWQVFEVAGLRQDEEGYRLPSILRNMVELFSLKSEAQATPTTN